MFTARGLANLGCLAFLALTIITLLYVFHFYYFRIFDEPCSAGYPIITYFTKPKLSDQGGFNLGGTNASGQVCHSLLFGRPVLNTIQVPQIPGNFGLIDLETPEEARTGKVSWDDGSPMQLIFSDEFNTDGRTFYPGDDPYWEAVDLHYWSVSTCIQLEFPMLNCSIRQITWNGMIPLL